MPKGEPAGERIIWDDANEKHLLLCILADANPSKLDWSKIATTFGKSLSSGAASQKYGKIKTRDKELFQGSGSSVATPVKKARAKSAAPSSNKRASNGKAKRQMAEHERDGDRDVTEDPEDGAAEIEQQKPSKRIKVERDTEAVFGGIDSAIDDDEY